MKTKLMILALIGVLLAGAMVFVSCDEAGGCSGNGKCGDFEDAENADKWCYYGGSVGTTNENKFKSCSDSGKSPFKCKC